MHHVRLSKYPESTFNRKQLDMKKLALHHLRLYNHGSRSPLCNQHFWMCLVVYHIPYTVTIAGNFWGVCISQTTNSILVREKLISRMEILNRAYSTCNIFQDLNFRGLAVLSRNINASKITNNPLYGS